MSIRLVIFSFYSPIERRNTIIITETTTHTSLCKPMLTHRKLKKFVTVPDNDRTTDCLSQPSTTNSSGLSAFTRNVPCHSTTKLTGSTAPSYIQRICCTDVTRYIINHIRDNSCSLPSIWPSYLKAAVVALQNDDK